MLNLFEVERAQVFILNPVQHIIKKSLKLQQQYGDQAITRLGLILPSLKTITDVSKADKRVLRVLTPIEGIDEGEALLIAKTLDTPDAILLSGDKRWMLALCKCESNSVRLLKKQLQGKVVSFEHLLLALLDEVGFAALAKSVTIAKLSHITLRILFPRHVEDPENHCREGLLSYLGELEAMAGGEFFHQI